MQFTVAAVAALMATSVAAWDYGTGSAAPSYTTEVVTKIETYCPYATEVTVGGKTYTVTEATTLTITDCPCTISKPVTVTPIVAPSPIYQNTTIVATTTKAPVAASTGATTAPEPTFTGAANRAVVGSAAGLAGLLGLAAFVL